MSRLAVLLTVVATLVVAGCGSGSSSSGSGGGADPARVAPASAPIYLEVTIRPSGKLGDDARDALKKLLNTDDPSGKLASLFDKSAKKDGLTYEDDVKPWLGERIGGFISAFGGGQKVTGAAAVDVTDMNKAKETLNKAIRTSDGKTVAVAKSTYKGVEIQTPASGPSLAFVDGYALVGTTDGVRQAIDVSKGGRPITDVADFAATRKAVSADRGLGFAYVQPQALGDALQALAGNLGSVARGQQALGVLRQLLGQAGRSVGVDLQANGDAIRIDAAALGAASPASPTSGADSLAELPGDAWLAVGFSDIGGSLTRLLGQLDQLSGAGGGQSVAGALQRFKQRTGVDVEKDILSWMGDGAIYARGRSLLDLGFVITVKSKDPAKSRAAVGKLAKLIGASGQLTVGSTNVPGYDRAVAVRVPSLPVPILIAAGGDRFSIGVNPQAFQDVRNPQTKLADSPQYAAAVKALGPGLKPVFLVDTPTVVNLVEALGASNAPGWSKVKPYLDSLGPLAAGVEHDGDTVKGAVALALR